MCIVGILRAPQSEADCKQRGVGLFADVVVFQKTSYGSFILKISFCTPMAERMSIKRGKEFPVT
jgi:hypothetical protein